MKETHKIKGSITVMPGLKPLTNSAKDSDSPRRGGTSVANLSSVTVILPTPTRARFFKISAARGLNRDYQFNTQYILTLLPVPENNDA